MSKKMMLLALAVVSAAFFAMPAIASAQEIHLEPGNGEPSPSPVLAVK